MKRFYCTYFDSNYLLKGIALIRSIGAQERHEYIIFVVCMDEQTKLILERLAIPYVIPGARTESMHPSR